MIPRYEFLTAESVKFYRDSASLNFFRVYRIDFGMYLKMREPNIETHFLLPEIEQPSARLSGRQVIQLLRFSRLSVRVVNFIWGHSLC